MDNLVAIYDQVVKVKDDLTAGKVASALEDTFPLQQLLVDALKRGGFGSAKGLESAVPPGEPDTNLPAKIERECQECIKCCDNPPAQTEGVGAFPMDGSIIKGILQALMTLLPLILRGNQSVAEQPNGE